MNEPVTERADAALMALLAAAEPRDARPLGGLVDRLAAAGRIRGERAPAARQCPIRGIAYDSRRVVPGGLFVAVPGEHVDGHDFVARAVAAGAVAVLVEHEVPDAGSAAQLVVDRGRLALAVAAAWWYDDPGRALGVIGVTGTDGKTTTAAMAVAALEAAGIRTGLVSTADQRIGGQRAATPTHVTTPEAPELQRALRAMAGAGDAAAVVETSSHGLALERVGEVPYDVAILTNLTHEHLELHGTFEAYRDAKRSLFERLGVGAGASPKPATLPGGRPWPRGGIVNLDDPSAGVFADATRGAGAAVLTYGTRLGADVRATAIHETPGGDPGHRRDAPRSRGGDPAAGGPLQRLTTRWRSSPWPSSWVSTAARSAAGSRASPASGAGWSALTADSRSWSSSTMPTRRPRWRRHSTRWPRSLAPGAGSWRSSGRLASATSRSGPSRDAWPVTGVVS